MPSKGNEHSHGLGSCGGAIKELKEKHYNPDTTKEDLLQLSLPEVDDIQFHGLVEYWFFDDFKVVILTVV